ncbi:MAG: GGDEF domain-containing protein, partial [Actinomycetota bacterium]|nr:GGDEF domain-containing protein [Actinomycetota bacterium]
MPQPGARPDPGSASPDAAHARDLLARTWTYRLSTAAVVPLTTEEVGTELRGQLDVLCSVLPRDPFDAAAVERVGEHVVGVGYIGEDGLRRTVEVLGKGLPALPEFAGVRAERIALGIG